MLAGIVGFHRVGKTTIFNALTGLHARVGFEQGQSRTERANVGVIRVPDPRLEKLAAIYHPSKITHAELTLVDVPGKEGARSALDQRTLAEMRNVDALVQVIGDFEDPEGYQFKDPIRQLEDFAAELVLADLAVVERRLERLRKEGKKDREVALLKEVRERLEAGVALREGALAPEDAALLAGFSLLSQMPLLVLVNIDEGKLGAGPNRQVEQWAEKRRLRAVTICGKMEMELAELGDEERSSFAAELGIEEPARERLLRAIYELLDLISFLTAGPKEVRAWTVKRGTKAIDAAAKVHSDMARGFIRAEIMSFDDCIAYGGESGCREAGKLRIEGKESVIEDGDVVHFRFNV